MLYNVNCLEFNDKICKNSNILSNNLFNAKNCTYPIKRVLGFYNIYKGYDCYKKLYILYLFGKEILQPFYVEYIDADKIINYFAFATLSEAIDFYNSINL